MIQQIVECTLIDERCVGMGRTLEREWREKKDLWMASRNKVETLGGWKFFHRSCEERVRRTGYSR